MAAQKTYQAGGVPIPGTLAGTETVVVGNGGPQETTVTTAQIAALANGGVQTVNTAISTVGNGTLTAAAIDGRLITRTGSTSAFTDTTDTALAIVAGLPAPFAGQSFQIEIINDTNFLDTLAAGSGVTLSGQVLIPANSWMRALVTLTSLTAVAIYGIEIGSNISLPFTKFQTAALSVGTLAAGAITGAQDVYYQNTGATPGAQTVRTAAQMFADIPGAYIGLVTKFRIINTGAGTLTLTADGGATVTITGTATIAQNVWRDYTLTFTSATAATIQSVGSGVSP